MPDLHIAIQNKVASVQGAPVIVTYNSDYRITFQFDSEWTAFPIRTARFVYHDRISGECRVSEVPFSGSTVDMPALSSTGEVLIGVYAGDLHTTTPAVIKCRDSILLGNRAHEAPTEDVYNQLLALFAEGVISVEELPAVTAADNGKFLRVVNGLWAASSVNSAEEAVF